MSEYLTRLNPNQIEAVQHTEGPLLVLAGAGSGKTTVLASRVTYILENTETKPWNILAITFTNKAANEMRARIARYIGEENAKNMWIGTFHSVCVRILRTCIQTMGYDDAFTIYDSADTKTVIKECEKELGIDEKSFPYRMVSSVISKAKNNMQEPEDFLEDNSNSVRGKIIAKIYRLYQQKLKKNNALDFDDIILLTVKALRDNKEIRMKYQDKFRYILVDEYQDTNDLQYELISLLANDEKNVCVVGDDDQSIYGFRGANINNILDFEDDFRGAKKVTLDENYRSTANILNAANSVISHNNKRHGKTLWTRHGSGEPISLYVGFNERNEAEFIAQMVKREKKLRGRFGDCTVLYRTNAQSRAIEEAFMQEAVPYKVLAGQKFYDRKEIKDIFAYMKVIYNPGDTLSIERIINEPKRKIGPTTVNKIIANAAVSGKTPYEVICSVEEFPDLKSAAPKIREFANIMEELREIAKTEPVDKVMEAVFNKTGYIEMLKNENTVESQSRMENLEALLNSATEFAYSPENQGTLGEYIEKISLMSDIDEYDEDRDDVNLMTVHSAKGLEFPVVFLAGMEEDLFPSGRSFDEEREIEEERRLCYVAITRAKEKLYITRTMSRMKFGLRVPCEESRFLREIPKECIADLSGGFATAQKNLDKVGIKVRPEVKWIKQKQKTPQAAMPAFDFRPNDRVRHSKFGDGTVVSSQSIGKDAIVVIDFDNVGTKRLMAAFAKLELIERGDR